jgi:hypothetical protein
MRIQTVLNWVVLGAIGRVVSIVDSDPNLMHQLLEIFFENVVMIVIAATAYAGHFNHPSKNLH